MIKWLQRRFALSGQGAKDLIKGCLACVAQDIALMLPVGLLYYLVLDLMQGTLTGGQIAFYTLMFSMMHGKLIRKNMIAAGGEMCDYWIVGDAHNE